VGCGWKLSPSSGRRSVARRAGCGQVWRWLGVGFFGVLCWVLALFVVLGWLESVRRGCVGVAGRCFWYGTLWCGSLWVGMGIGAIEGLILWDATIPEWLEAPDQDFVSIALQALPVVFLLEQVS
jgi:hypothetical protein